MRLTPNLKELTIQVDQSVFLLASIRNSNQKLDNIDQNGLQGNIQQIQRQIQNGFGAIALIQFKDSEQQTIQHKVNIGGVQYILNISPIVQRLVYLKRNNETGRIQIDYKTSHQPSMPEFQEYDLSKVVYLDIQSAINGDSDNFKTISLL